MKQRSILLLFSAFLLGALTVFGYSDSGVKEAPTCEAYQLTLDSGSDFVAFIDAAEVTEIFVLPAVDLGYAKTGYILPAEKLAFNYVPVARPPPDRCQKSDIFNSKLKTEPIANKLSNQSRAGYRVS
jgi:hypothetical protein